MSRGVVVDGKSLVHMAAYTMYLLVLPSSPTQLFRASGSLSVKSTLTAL